MADHKTNIQSDGSESCPHLQVNYISTGLYKIIFDAAYTHLGGSASPHTSGNTATSTAINDQEVNIQIEDSSSNDVDDDFTLTYSDYPLK